MSSKRKLPVWKMLVFSLVPLVTIELMAQLADDWEAVKARWASR